MKVTTLHKEDFETQCKILFSKIHNKPDVVVGILNGGGFVLEEYKKTASPNIELATVKLQRDSTKGIKGKVFYRNF